MRSGDVSVIVVTHSYLRRLVSLTRTADRMSSTILGEAPVDRVMTLS